MLGMYKKAAKIATKMWKSEWSGERKDSAGVYIDEVSFNMNEDFTQVEYRVEDCNGQRRYNIILPCWVKTSRDLAIYMLAHESEE